MAGIASPQIIVILLNGFGIINLSQVLSTHFFLKPIPTGRIDELLRREMLRMPSLTLWRGPLGPSGEIPIEIPFLRDLSFGVLIADHLYF